MRRKHGDSDERLAWAAGAIRRVDRSGLVIAMDERLHPFNGFASAYQVLCDLADDKGWKVRLDVVDGDLQLELRTSFGRLPYARQTARRETLDELANEILAKVIA